MIDNFEERKKEVGRKKEGKNERKKESKKKR
jgi:hypothetical protein